MNIVSTDEIFGEPDYINKLRNLNLNQITIYYQKNVDLSDVKPKRVTIFQCDDITSFGSPEELELDSLNYELTNKICHDFEYSSVKKLLLKNLFIPSIKKFKNINSVVFSNCNIINYTEQDNFKLVNCTQKGDIVLHSYDENYY